MKHLLQTNVTPATLKLLSALPVVAVVVVVVLKLAEVVPS
jgi:hypothetical protein